MKKLIILILLLAFGVRLFLLGVVPVGTYVDETAIGLDAYMIAKTGKDMHGNLPFTPLFYSYGDFKLPTYIWATVPSVHVFGRTAFAIRFPSAVAGVISVALVYGIALQMFRKYAKKSLIAAGSSFSLAILPWDVLFSRTGFEGHLGQMFLLAMVFFLLRSKQNRKMFILSLVFGVCALYSYYSARFVVLPVFIAVAWLVQQHVKYRRRQIRNVLVMALIGMFVFFISFIPMLRSPLYTQSQQLRLSSKNILQQQDVYVQQANMLQAQDHDSILSHVLHHRSIYLAKNFARQFFLHLDPEYLFLSGDSNLRHSTGRVGLMLPSMLPFFIAGLYVLAKKERSILVVLLLWWGVSLIPASVPLEVPHALRSLHAVGVLPLILGFGMVELAGWSQKTTRRRLFFGFTICVLVFNTLLFFHDYFTQYPARSAAAWSDGYLQVAETVAKYRKDVGQMYVLGGQKLLLWVLYYGGFGPQEIRAFAQNAKNTQFDQAQVDNIFVNPVAWEEKIPQLSDNGVLVVGNRDVLHAKRTMGEEHILQGAGGDTNYAYYLVKTQ